MAEKCCCEQCAHRRKLDAEVVEGYRLEKIRLAHEVDRLRGEVDSLRQDAMRYRWLRDECGLIDYKVLAGSVGLGMLPSGEPLDAAVDRLMVGASNE